MVGGNLTATLQQKTTTKNAIGERVPAWTDVCTLVGWLDYMSGESKYTTYNAKLQESTHVFVCDYNAAVERNAENKQLVANGLTFDVLLIDDPMELHQHLEFYLRFVG